MQNDGLAVIGAVVQTLLLCIQIPTLIALVVYVVKTWEMASATRRSAEIAESTLREMRDARDQEVAPYVIVSFDVNMNRNIIYLTVRNIGKTIATNVKLSFDPELAGDFFSRHGKSNLVDKIIPSMPPGHEIRALFDTVPRYLASGGPLSYTARISYYGGLNTEEKIAEYVLDLSPYKGLTFTRDYDLTDATKELKNIVSNQNKMIVAIQRLATILENQKGEPESSPIFPETTPSQMDIDETSDVDEQIGAS